MTDLKFSNSNSDIGYYGEDYQQVVIRDDESGEKHYIYLNINDEGKVLISTDSDLELELE